MLFQYGFESVVRKALVQAVKSITTDPLGDDYWRSFVHHFSDDDQKHDPNAYHGKFLSRFLQEVCEKTGSESDYAALQRRKRRGHQRDAPMLKKLRVEPAQINAVWLLVGELGMEKSFLQNSVSCRVEEVCLPLDRVVHSGVAAPMLLAFISTDFLQKEFNVKFSDDLRMSCVHYEGGFEVLPTNQFTCGNLL